MPKAIWKGEIIAESESTEVVEGNHYFPPDSVREDLLRPSETKSVCPWKGTAKYYHVAVGEDVNSDAAWYYPEPSDEAANIRDYVAFWKGVEVEG